MSVWIFQLLSVKINVILRKNRRRTQHILLSIFVLQLQRVKRRNKMAQIIKTVVEREAFIESDQVSQILYINNQQNDNEVIEINYNRDDDYVVVKYKGEFFKLHSPDIRDLSIYQVLEYLNCSQGQIQVIWVQDGNRNNVINTPICDVPLNQIDVIV